MARPVTILLAPFEPALGAAITHAEPGVVVVDASQNDGKMRIDLAFIDWLLPDGSGFELCRTLRRDMASATARIVMVLDEPEREICRRALQAGADDYCIAPLTVEQVRLQLARGEREVPVPSPRADHAIRSGAIEVDPAAGQARVSGKPVALSPIEFRLLSHLVQRHDRVQSREDLIRAVGKTPDAIDGRTVDVWVGRLRRTIRTAGYEIPIRTVRPLGYVLDS